MGLFENRIPLNPRVHHHTRGRPHFGTIPVLISLVVAANPSEKYASSSVGVTIPNIWKNKINVPNHQPILEI
jgi:hypothetical protein